MQLHSHSLLQLFKHNLVYILWKGRDLYFSYFDVMGRLGLEEGWGGGDHLRNRKRDACSLGHPIFTNLLAQFGTPYYKPVYLQGLGQPPCELTCPVWNTPLASSRAVPSLGHPTCELTCPVWDTPLAS